MTSANNILMMPSSKVASDKQSFSVSSAKNAVLPLLFASMLTKSTTKLHLSANFSLVDSEAAISIIEYLGGVVEKGDHFIKIDAEQIENRILPSHLSKTTRYSLLILGVMLTRFGSACVSLPGGCSLNRPHDYHLDAISKLGCIFESGALCIRAFRKSCTTNQVILKYPSVGATLNALFCALGSTSRDNSMITLQNCAIEPEIDDVISCLTKQGFLVKRDWRSIQIRFNRKRVSGEIHHYPINDRIEAASYAFAAAMFGVQAIIENAPMMTMAAPLSLLVRLGCSVKTVGDLLIVDGRFVKRHLSISVVAEPYPGFPTDLQPLFVALCTAQSAPCNIYDSVMPQRTQYVAALRALGANIIVNEFGINIFPYANSSTISGISNSTTPLALAIPDIRGGMAVILVALQTGTACRFSDFEQVRRGYLKVENIINKLGGEAREC